MGVSQWLKALAPESGRFGFESASATPDITMSTTLSLSDLLFLYLQNGAKNST